MKVLEGLILDFTDALVTMCEKMYLQKFQEPLILDLGCWYSL